MTAEEEDMSELSEAQRAVVERVRAARARGAERTARGEATLAEGKQAFPVGMTEDGRLNEVED